MFISRLLLFICVFLFSVTTIISIKAYSQENNRSKKFLSIKDVAELTLENNKNIKVSETQVEAVEGNILEAKSVFNLFLEGKIDKNYDVTPLTIDYRSNLFQQSDNYIENDLFDYSINVYKKLKSGTLINSGISFTNYGKDTLYSFLKENGFGEYITNRSNVFLRIKQPLIRGAGKSYNSTFLRVNKKKFISFKKQYYNDIAKSLLASFIAYIDYIGAKKLFEIKKNIDNNFLMVIEQIESLIELDALPASDMNLLKAFYLDKKSELIIAENDMLNRKNILAGAIGINTNEKIKTIEAPNEFFVTDIDFNSINNKDEYIDYIFQKSLINRNDLHSLELDLDIGKDLIEYHRKSIKPIIDLNMSIGYNGIYESNNFNQFYKPYYENIPGMNYSLGISFLFNPNNDLNKGKLIKEMAKLEEKEYLIEKFEEELYKQVSVYYNTIFNYKEIILKYKDAMENYKIALENEKIKLNLGSSTLLNLIQIQDNYYFTMQQLNKAILELNLSIIYFRYLTGTLCSITNDNVINIDYPNLFSLPY